MKQADCGIYAEHDNPAAFGRLCVETVATRYNMAWMLSQPPSGGCVLKLKRIGFSYRKRFQPPSGGCVLKLYADNLL